MSFLDRLNEIIAVKQLEPKAVRDRTGIPYDQLDRLGTGPRGPCAAKLRDIVLGLDLDADYLLETDDRYKDMTPMQAAANMALDRYLVTRARAGDPISEREAAEMRHVANRSARAPLWVEDWGAHHERMVVSAEARPELPPRPEARQRRITGRRVGH
jgi:hypothetical protein